VDSSELVRYVSGQTGSDGVHYGAADAQKWAKGVQRQLRRIL
jgi:lysophospholipase L1-like esterase